MRSIAGRTCRPLSHFPQRLPTLAILAVLTAPALFLLVGPLGPAAAASSVPLLAIDADSSANGPRAVAAVDDCVSAASPDRQVTIDVVLPPPGVPAGRGIAAYQFNLFYDPAVLSIAAEDHRLLLNQAPGSALLPISEATPDSNGIFFSGAADFGPKGIEDAGASETGPGVLVRLTLQPKAPGSSPLLLRDIILLDDESQSIGVDSVQTATVLVGQSCPGRSDGALPAPVPSPAAAPAAPADPPPTAPSGPTSLAPTGGPPPGSPSLPGPIIALGAAPMLAGTALLLLGRRSPPRAVSALSCNNPGKVAGHPAAVSPPLSREQRWSVNP